MSATASAEHRRLAEQQHVFKVSVAFMKLGLTEALLIHACTVRSPVLYLTFEEDELDPHLAVVTRVLVSNRDALQLARPVCLHLRLHNTGMHACASVHDVAVLSTPTAIV